MEEASKEVKVKKPSKQKQQELDIEFLKSRVRYLESLEGQVSSISSDFRSYKSEHLTVLKQYGALRVALQTLQRGFETAAQQLEISLGYTQKEVSAMGSEEYRDKILKPLGMGK